MFVDAGGQADPFVVLAGVAGRVEGELFAVAAQVDILLVDAGDVRDDTQGVVCLVDVEVYVRPRGVRGGGRAATGAAGASVVHHVVHHPLYLPEELVEGVVAVVSSHAREYVNRRQKPSGRGSPPRACGPATAAIPAYMTVLVHSRDVRLVQITIPTGKRETVTRALDDEEIDYIVTDETSGREYAAVAYVPLPTNAVEPVLDTLRAAGIDESTYTVVLDAETVVSDDFDELEERFAEEENGDRIAREELVAAAEDLVLSTPVYLVMTVVSAVIATAGLLLNSPAVIVGSMVIAPLIGPAMAASVGTVVVDDELFAKGVKMQAVGVLVSVASAAVFAWLVRTVHLIPPFTDVTAIPQVRSRLYPDFLSLVVALGAGVAGVVSLSSGVSTALVGVMIAVALMPPAATIGIGLAWGQPLVSLGSTILLLVNVLSINLAALIVLWYKGYRPSQWFRTDEAQSATITRIGVLVSAIVLLSAFLGGVTLDSFERASTEEEIRVGAEEIITEAGASVVAIEIEHTNTAVFQQPSSVVVTVGVPPDVEPPDITAELDAMADRTAGRNVDTEVRFVTVENAQSVVQSPF